MGRAKMLVKSAQIILEEAELILKDEQVEDDEALKETIKAAKGELEEILEEVYNANE